MFARKPIGPAGSSSKCARGLLVSTTSMWSRRGTERTDGHITRAQSFSRTGDAISTSHAVSSRRPRCSMMWLGRNAPSAIRCHTRPCRYRV